MKKTSFLLIIGVITVLVVGSYSGYLYWKKSSLVIEQQKIDKAFVQAQNDLVQYDGKQIDSAISAKQSITAIKDSVVEWSSVIRQIRATVPKGKDGPLVNIVSYSGASGHEISMNVKTVAKSENAYLDIAKLINAFDNSEYFSNNFVSSISSGNDSNGYEILSFVFTTNF